MDFNIGDLVVLDDRFMSFKDRPLRIRMFAMELQRHPTWEWKTTTEHTGYVLLEHLDGGPVNYSPSSVTLSGCTVWSTDWLTKPPFLNAVKDLADV